MSSMSRQPDRVRQRLVRLGLLAAGVILVNWLAFPRFEVSYSRLLVTTLLMMEGLALAVFAQTVCVLFANRAGPHIDGRTLWLAASLFAGFLLLSTWPLTQQWFKLGLQIRPHVRPDEHRVSVDAMLLCAHVNRMRCVQPRVLALSRRGAKPVAET